MVVFGFSVLVPAHFPAPQTCVQCETTESDVAGEDVPFHVPATSASVTGAGAAGAGAGAAAAAVVSAAAGASSFFAHATATAAIDSKIKTRRMTFSRLAAEKGEVIAVGVTAAAKIPLSVGDD